MVVNLAVHSLHAAVTAGMGDFVVVEPPLPEGIDRDLQASQERWVTIGELACSSIVAPRASCCGQDQVSTPDLSRG